jgi:hypothetical protein
LNLPDLVRPVDVRLARDPSQDGREQIRIALARVIA